MIATFVALTACADKPVDPESLKGEWCWVETDVPELILVLDTDDAGNLVINDLYTYRFESYKNPTCSFDGEMLEIHWSGGENCYLELYLKPEGKDLKGRCLATGLLASEYDCDITLRRDYFEYDQ